MIARQRGRGRGAATPTSSKRSRQELADKQPTELHLTANSSAVLLAQSGIDCDIADSRGYRHVKDADDLALLGFTNRQCRVPGLLVPVWSVVSGEGVVLHQFRPEEPRSNDKGGPIKYETAAGSRMRVDCHPSARPLLGDVAVPLWITEGVRKGDAAVSAGLCCVALLGVWNWRGTLRDDTKGPLEDWGAITLVGRDVFVAYDSDVMRKPAVQDALDSLTVFLTLHGARVQWVLLPGGVPDLATGEPEKVGLDDYLVQGHTVEDLLSLARSPRPGVNLNKGFHDKTTAALACLQIANDPPRIFRRADVLVEAQPSGSVVELTKDRMKFLTGKHFTWYKPLPDGARKEEKPNTEIVGNAMQAVEEWPFPTLSRVVTSPVFADDGSLQTTRGHHAKSGLLYLPPDGLKVPAVPDHPTKGDVKRAVDMFVDVLFGEFPFVTDADRGHALALALQPFARALIRGTTPLFGVESPKQGTGKTILVQSALAAAIGDVGGMAEPHGDEEMEKRITTAMAAAQPVFFVDNVDRLVKYPSLASALTKTTWQGRILGKSQGVSVPVTCAWVITANNPQYSDDLSRRVVPIRLDAEQEQPHTRSGFKLSLPSHALDNRADFIWAACVLVRAWLVRGQPAPADDVPHLGSFGPWRRVMGGIVGVLGMPDFLGNLSRLDDSNPETEAFQLLARRIVQHFGLGTAFTSGDVKHLAEHPDIYSYIDPSGGRGPANGFPSRLGQFLTRRVNQIVNGWRLERVSTRGSAGGKRYRFVKKAKGSR